VHPVTYRERLTPPWWAWLLAAFWASTLGIAYGYAVATGVGWAVGVGLFLVAGLAIVRMTAVVEVTATTLRAGRATLPLSVVDDATALDAVAARTVRGTEADPRAFALLRGWIARAVIVELGDPDDPTPYWYVSTRRPEELASVICQAASASGRDKIG
jgi:hypothetical protein